MRDDSVVKSGFMVRFMGRSGRDGVGSLGSRNPMTARILLLITMWTGLLRPSARGADDAATVAPEFAPLTVDATVGIGYGLAISDIDGDRRPDIILADKDVLAWYRNPSWTRHILVERLTELDHVCVAAEDVDGDGRAEVVAGAGWNPGDTFTSGALFYLKPGEDRTQRWTPVRLAHDPTIHRIHWARHPQGGFDLLSLPLHGRGNRNGRGDGVRFLAYHPPEDREQAWTTTTLHKAWHATHNFDVLPRPAGRGDELLVAAREGVFWLTPGEGTWRVQPLATNGPGMPEFVGAGEVRAGWLGQRVTMVATIEPMHGNQLVVYTPPSVNDPSPLWQRRVIDDTLVDGHALACGDVLGLGQDQIVAGWRAMNRPGSRVGIRLYQALDPAGERWKAHVIDDNEMACEDLKLADLDGDGDLDIIAAGRATRNLRIYDNRRVRR